MTAPARTDRRRPAKREAILAAATAVFLRHGYARTSVDAIAAEAGVSKRTVYNHFTDKEELFLAVVSDAHRVMFETASVDIASLLADPSTLADDLTTLGRRVLDYLLEPQVAALRRLIIAEVAHHPRIGEACRQGVPERIAGWLASRLAELTSRGMLRVDRPERAAHQFISLLVIDGLAASTYGIVPLDRASADDIVGSAVEIFLRAYA